MGAAADAIDGKPEIIIQKQVVVQKVVEQRGRVARCCQSCCHFWSTLVGIIIVVGVGVLLYSQYCKWRQESEETVRVVYNGPPLPVDVKEARRAARVADGMCDFDSSYDS